MINTYTNPSGRIVIANKALDAIIEEKIAMGACNISPNPTARQDSFSMNFKFEDKTLSISGTYTWDEEGFDAIEIDEI